MEQLKGNGPVSHIAPKRNPCVCNLRTRITKARGYLAKSTASHLRSEWESRINHYTTQLAAAEVKARLHR